MCCGMQGKTGPKMRRPLPGTTADTTALLSPRKRCRSSKLRTPPRNLCLCTLHYTIHTAQLKRHFGSKHSTKTLAGAYYCNLCNQCRKVTLPCMHRTKQKVFNAMVTTVDETAKNVSEALKRSGLWKDTLLIWSTDVRSVKLECLLPLLVVVC